MYKLYNVKAWGSVAIHCLLEEMELPYTNIWMTPDQVRAPQYREISPLGLIPALGLADGRTLFESAAIVSFLVTAHPEKGLSPVPGSDDFGEFLSWLHFMSANLYQTINLSLGENAYAMDPGHDRFLAEQATRRTNDFWQILDRRLAAEGPWLMGDGFSALDIYGFMLTLWSRPSEPAVLGRFPQIAQLARAVRARPKLKAALEAHGIMEIGSCGG